MKAIFCEQFSIYINTSEILQKRIFSIDKQSNRVSSEDMESIDGNCSGALDEILETSFVHGGPEEKYHDIREEPVQFTINEDSVHVFKTPPDASSISLETRTAIPKNDRSRKRILNRCGN